LEFPLIRAEKSRSDLEWKREMMSPEKARRNEKTGYGIWEDESGKGKDLIW